MRRIVVITSAAGSGGTTFARTLAGLLDVLFVELDAIYWQPGWAELDADEFRRRVEPVVAQDAWVIDGRYRGKLGDLVFDRADTVVWIDLPRRVWLPRLIGRTLSRVVRREPLWNGNRESFRNVILRRDSLILFALRNERPRRQRYPTELAAHNLVRLRTKAEIDAFLRAAMRG